MPQIVVKKSGSKKAAPMKTKDLANMAYPLWLTDTAAELRGDVRVPYIKGMLLRRDCPCDIQNWYCISTEAIRAIAEGRVFKNVVPTELEEWPGYERPQQTEKAGPAVDIDYLLGKLVRLRDTLDEIESELRHPSRAT